MLNKKRIQILYFNVQLNFIYLKVSILLINYIDFLYYEIKRLNLMAHFFKALKENNESQYNCEKLKKKTQKKGFKFVKQKYERECFVFKKLSYTCHL